jgi:hypothetical protein
MGGGGDLVIKRELFSHDMVMDSLSSKNVIFTTNITECLRNFAQCDKEKRKHQIDGMQLKHYYNPIMVTFAATKPRTKTAHPLTTTQGQPSTFLALPSGSSCKAQEGMI